MESLCIVLVLLPLAKLEQPIVHQWFVNVPWKVQVYKEETKQRELLTLACVANYDLEWAGPVDHADIKVKILSIYPRDLCQHCFAVYKNGTSPYYKLYYDPSRGNIRDISTRGLHLRFICSFYDFDPTDHYLEIKLRTNQPPSFTSLIAYVTGINASATVKDTILYTVTDATDPNPDQLLYDLTAQSESSENKYSIGLTDGKIRAAVDLSTECGQTVQLLVTVRDFLHAPVGPKVITLTFSDCNQEMESTTAPTTTTPQSTSTPTTTPSNLSPLTQTEIQTSTEKSLFPGYSSQMSEASSIAWICVLSVTGCVAIVTTAFLVYRLCLSIPKGGSIDLKNRINRQSTQLTEIPNSKPLESSEHAEPLRIRDGDTAGQ